MRLLITGGEGFIGLALIRYIINDTKHTFLDPGNTEFLYKRIDEFERNITSSDPLLNIDWAVGFFSSLSEKDINSKFFEEAKCFS